MGLSYGGIPPFSPSNKKTLTPVLQEIIASRPSSTSLFPSGLFQTATRVFKPSNRRLGFSSFNHGGCRRQELVLFHDWINPWWTHAPSSHLQKMYLSAWQQPAHPRTQQLNTYLMLCGNLVGRLLSFAVRLLITYIWTDAFMIYNILTAPDSTFAVRRDNTKFRSPAKS